MQSPAAADRGLYADGYASAASYQPPLTQPCPFCGRDIPSAPDLYVRESDHGEHELTSCSGCGLAWDL